MSQPPPVASDSRGGSMHPQKETVMRRPRPLLAVVALLALAGLAATAVTATPDRAAGRETQLQRALDRVVAAGVPGAVLLVREGDRTIRLASGYENLKPRTPMRADDRFRVGSITKTFVATLVLQLVAERRLPLEDTVSAGCPGSSRTGSGSPCTSSSTTRAGYSTTAATASSSLTLIGTR